MSRMQSTYLLKLTLRLSQLCSIRGLACGPVKALMRPNLGFRCSKCILHTNNLSFLLILSLIFLMQMVLSAALSRLLPLGFERFQYFSLS